MFVKFGQIASTRTDLLPEVLTTELAQLQSAARPGARRRGARRSLEQELGATVEEEFASFDFEPLAAASIGQTHRAVLKTGEHVVVKVQRPGIEDIVHRDAAVLRMAAGFVERRVEAARVARRQAAGRGAHHVTGEASSTTARKRRAASRSSSTSRTTTASRRRRCTSRSRRGGCW